MNKEPKGHFRRFAIGAVVYVAVTLAGAIAIKVSQDSQRERLNGMGMPGIQPTRNVFFDKEEETYRTKVGVVGPYLKPVEYWRDSTGGEIEWYLNNSTEDGYEK